MEKTDLTDGDVNADVVTTESHILFQLEGLMEVRHFTEITEERLRDIKMAGG